MESRELSGHGRLFRFLADDHARLDDLLTQAMNRDGSIDRTLYDAFRAGLLRHIGMEERIFLPAVQRLAGGQSLPIAVPLRFDHAALPALRTILLKHNTCEEGPDGLD
jgi:hypothetical protein